MQYLVTPTGDIVGADPVTLRRLAGTMVSNGAMAGFLIRNFGYGGISCVGNSMSVRIATSRLRLAAQGRIAGFIRDCKPGRVSLAYYCGGWQFEIIPGGEAALERIAQLVIKARNDGGPQTYISEPRALESLVKDNLVIITHTSTPMRRKRQLTPIFNVLKIYVGDIRRHAAPAIRYGSIPGVEQRVE